MNKNIVKGYILSIISAVIYGSMPLMADYIYADGVNSFTLVFLRNFLALPLLALLAYFKEGSLKISIKEIPKISLISLFGCAITPVLLLSSYNYIASGTATVFHFIYPALVVILSMIFFKKKPNLITVISVVLCFAGITQFYNPAEKLNLTGSILALSSGLALAIYILLLSGLKTEAKPFTFTFYVVAIGSLIMLIFCLATNNLTLPKSLLGAALCLLFASAVTVGAFATFQQSTFLIGGEKASILSTIEPITSVVLGFLFLNEQVSLKIIIGCAMVISASVLITLFEKK